MTEKQARNEAARHYRMLAIRQGEKFPKDRYKFKAIRRAGKCVLLIVERPLREWKRPRVGMIGRADTWERAVEQMRSGMFEAA